ncbi:24642_t:CDS:2, partial [Gigaspora rosea]
MSAFRNKTLHPEAYTLLLKVYQEVNPTKKRDIAIREAQACGTTQASSTTIAKDTTEDITENTTEVTTDYLSKSRETLAQTKLKEELIRLNQELSQLQDREDK